MGLSASKFVAQPASQYAGALHQLLPRGTAWDWPEGGVGDTLLNQSAMELARIGADAIALPSEAVAAHKTVFGGHLLSDYQAVLDAAIGVGVGVASTDTTIPLAVGARVGDKVWSTWARFYLRIRAPMTKKEEALKAINAVKLAHVAVFFQGV